MGSSGVQREKVFPEPGQGSVYQAKVKGPPGGGGRLSIPQWKPGVKYSEESCWGVLVTRVMCTPLPPDKGVCSPFWGCCLDANQTLAELQHPGSQNSQLPCVYMKHGYPSIVCYSAPMPF